MDLANLSPPWWHPFLAAVVISWQEIVYHAPRSDLHGVRICNFPFVFFPLFSLTFVLDTRMAYQNDHEVSYGVKNVNLIKFIVATFQACNTN